MKVVALLFALSLAVAAHSQNTIHNYRYVLVPERFEFSKSDNQYGLNTFSKALLEGVGFTAFMSDETLPAEVAANKCGVLKAEVVEKKRFLSTGLTLILKDCLGNVVFKGEEGKSREKEWELAYSEALRNAFASLTAAQYKYDSTTATPVAAAPVVSSVPAAIPAAVPATVAESGNVLYAQANANGYQLIDTTPKKVMTLLKTSQPDSFIADDGTSKGIVFRRNGEWFFEYYKEDKLVSQKLSIKF
ncbi:hypothetical protein HNQ91_003799 [Filimonas zeae]|uniref:Uncharacterized protein n=1 Tax=Filimonas zeae TaxID=1737353 RepID=A0A917J0G8_9BACT|nr:hypothetical protein [Filimonas zeae]MDR6340734.1 hypothetical protein [Filimonas zeae]GGH74125.1 hypothetical protein GCM10011379_36400 [Filimonas zeae]